MSTYNSNIITEKEKEALKASIASSIKKVKLKKRLVYLSYGVAASIALLLSVNLYVSKIINSDIENFINSSNIALNNHQKEIELIFSNNQKQAVNNNALISYSEKGAITISDSKIQEQKQQLAYHTVIVPYGKQSKVKLSDGSKIWLNSGSKLVYPVVFTGNKREVYIEGEAIFDVAHNKQKPFFVLSEKHKVKVLGTVFNVCNYPEEGSIQTTLKSGAIQIELEEKSLFKKNRIVQVLPGKASVFNKNNNKITVNTIDVTPYFSWKKDYLTFNKAPLDVMMKKISRHYNVVIDLQGEKLTKQTFTGTVDVNKDLKNVLNTLKEISDFTILYNQNSIIINQKK